MNNRLLSKVGLKGLIVFVFFFVFSFLSAQDMYAVSLNGFVVDDDTGADISGANVTGQLRDENNAICGSGSDTTDSNGVFSISINDVSCFGINVSWSVTASKAGYTTRSANGDYNKPAGNEGVGTIRLNPSGGGSVPAPTGLNATAGACGSGTITVTWNPVAGATSYQLYRNGTLVYNGTATTRTFTGLTNGFAYNFYVRATGSDGSQSPNSNTDSATIPNCASPTNTPTPTHTPTPTPSGTCTFNITGRVIDEDNNAGIPSASVTMTRSGDPVQSATTNATGNFSRSFTHACVSGTNYIYNVNATKAGCTTGGGSVILNSGNGYSANITIGLDCGSPTNTPAPTNTPTPTNPPPPSACAAPIVTNINVSQDTSIRGGTLANNNYGSLSSLYLGSNIFGWEGWGYAFLKYNIPSLSVLGGSRVVSAQLQPSVNTLGPLLSNFVAFPISSSWSENTVTWNTAPGTGSQIAAVPAYSAPVPALDVTNYVIANLGVTASIAVGLGPPIGGASAQLGSREANASNNRLIITTCDDGGVISGRVYNAATSAGLDQATVNLYREGAGGLLTLISSQTTPASGTYSFTGLATASTYRLELANKGTGRSTWTIVEPISGVNFWNSLSTGSSRNFGLQPPAVPTNTPTPTSQPPTATPTPLPPGAPTVTTSATCGAILTISFSSVSGATSYTLNRSFNADMSSPTTVGTWATPPTPRTVNLNDQHAGRTIYFQVIAVVGGVNQYSAISSGTASPLCPPVLTGTAIACNGGIDLSWTRIDGASNYVIFKDGLAQAPSIPQPAASPVTSSDTAATVNPSYTYKIEARNAYPAGTSESNTATVNTVPACLGDTITVSGTVLVDNNANGVCTDAVDTPYDGGTILRLYEPGNSTEIAQDDSSTVAPLGSYTLTGETSESGNGFSVVYNLPPGYNRLPAWDVTSSVSRNYNNGYVFPMVNPLTRELNPCIGNSAPWFQTDFGDVRMPAITNQVPVGESAVETPIVTNKLPVFYSTLGSGQFGNDDPTNRIKVNNEYNYNTASTTKKGTTSYTYYDSLIDSAGITPKTIPSFGCNNAAACDFDPTPSDFGSPPDAGVLVKVGSINSPINLTLTGFDLPIPGASFPQRQRIVILVSGNLTINNDIILDSGDMVIFAVKGDINVASNVTRIDGIFTSEGNINIAGRSDLDCAAGAADTPLLVNGNLVANSFLPFANNGSGQVNMDRNLCTGNATEPALKVKMRYEFITSLTNFYRISQQTWREVEP